MIIKKIMLWGGLILAYNLASFAQGSESDALYIRNIHRQALNDGFAYNTLRHITKSIGPRFSGTPGASAGVEYTRQVMIDLGLDSVWTQPCLVPRWNRGEPSKVSIINSVSVGTIELSSITLGNSIGTSVLGITAEIVEVKSLDEVDELGEGLRGKIVFFNREADQGQYRTFNAYGGAVDQRVFGASRAAKYGSLGVIVRSITPNLDDVPHTGSMVYTDTLQRIPAIAISTMAANFLGELCKKEKVRVNMYSGAELMSPTQSFNVIGEIKGTEFPDEIILVGGHLDSWDIGEGAHDDGAGCVHALDVMYILKKLKYAPKRTIRCVMFMNEENGLKGALQYQKISDSKGEFHLAAIESDSGGFTPRSFSCDGDTSIFKKKFQKMNTWSSLLEPYYLTFEKGGSGADINPLKGQKGMLIGLRTDSQRYFDYHHSVNDTFDKVNIRELELGSAAMTSLVYLIDKYGL